MKVVLVSTYAYPLALGLRYVSSYLKAAGHDVEMIFMNSKRATAKPDYSRSVVEAFIERCRQADLVGLSLMTNTFHRSCMLTETLRQAGNKAPVIWGGTHPTVAPEESLQVADMVCVGEGEEPMLQLVERLEEGQDPTAVGSIGFRAGGPFGNQETIRNAVLPLNEGLDEYPFPDYELHTHWVIEKRELVPARPDNLRGTLRHLRVESARGCPYSCAFCNNAALRKVHEGKGPWVRKRSNENVIAEIEKARASFPGIEMINVVDDLFFIRNEEEMADFVAQYRERVNLPIQLDAFPNTITEGKVAVLARLPIDLISMGIQSGSPDTLKNIYTRPTPLKKIIEGMNLFRRYGLRTEYHYLVTNPFEPDENVIQTMRFIATHHRGPTVLRIFPLMFYPGTPLFDRACREGLFEARDPHAYDHVYTSRTQFARHDYLGTWLRIVLHLRNVRVPSWVCHRLIDVVTSRLVRKGLDRPAFMPLAFGTYRVVRKIYKILIYQPLVRPLGYLRRKPRYGQLRPEDQPARSPASVAGQSPPRWTATRGNQQAGRRRHLPEQTSPAAKVGAADGGAESSQRSDPAVSG